MGIESGLDNRIQHSRNGKRYRQLHSRLDTGQHWHYSPPYTFAIGQILPFLRIGRLCLDTNRNL